MKISKSISPPIPTGLQIYDEGKVAGINYRKDAAIRFVRGKEHQLELVREPSNRHDPNAIQIIGSVKGLLGRKRLFIGYVPADIAKRLVSIGVLGSVTPRLRYLRSDGDYVTVSFEILGPKSTIEQYRPKNKKERKTRQRKKTPFDVVFADVYEILDGSYPDYDSKKVSKALFKQVFPEFLDRALQKISMSQEDFNNLEEGDGVLNEIQDRVIDMIDDIFDRLFEIKPDLERKS